MDVDIPFCVRNPNNDRYTDPCSFHTTADELRYLGVIVFTFSCV